MEHFDLIVLGAGSAARDGAKKAATQYGAKVALVESTRWGGSCPNVACKPTKAYLVVAELMHDVNTISGMLGIEVGPATIDLGRVKARKDSLMKPPPKWVEDLRGQGLDTYDGEATFVDATTVRVGEQELSAERILIATGSRTAIPPIEGIDDVDWLDHVSALELTERPESLLVVGGGAVGLEFGQAFSRFGSRVTIVDASMHVAPRSDMQAAEALTAALEAEEIGIVLGSHVTSLRREDGAIAAAVTPKAGGESSEVRVTHVLLASGRAPNIEALGLDALGIETHRLGIVVDEHMRTSVDGVWASGDVTGMYQFTPMAQYQARIAIEDMFGTESPAADYSVLPTAIFTDPELAGVGLTEEQARDEGLDFETVVHELEHVQRASYTDTKHGLYKIVFEQGSRRVLGLHVVARGAGDIVQGFSIGLRLGVTVDELAAMHHAFPTFGEGVKAAAEQAMPENVPMAGVRW